MKHILILLLLCFAFQSFAQKVDDCENCVYNVQVRDRLSYLYQDKSDAFYKCEYTDEYQSIEWAAVTFVEIFSGRQSQFKQHLQAQIPLDTLLSKFPEATATHNLLAIKYDYLDYNENEKSEIVIYNGLDPNEFRIDRNESGWITSHVYKNNQSGVSGLILPRKWKSQKLSTDCNELINYVDCMIDSETEIYTYDRSQKRSYISEPFKPLFDFIDDKLPKLELENQIGYSNDEYDEEMGKRNLEKIEKYNSLKNKITKELAHSNDEFKKLYEDAKLVSTSNQFSNEQFEKIVEFVEGPSGALQLKRNREVMGSCSMDNGPINHLKDIARLSAYSAEWDVFLRSHMNVINDRFSSVASSSYGEQGRNTPIHDLEAIGLEPDKLFVGSLLRAKDTKKNHYYSSFHRISRAIPQLSDPKPSVNLLKEVIQNKSNDIPNRLNAWFTLLNINYYDQSVISKQEVFDLLDDFDEYGLQEYFTEE